MFIAQQILSVVICYTRALLLIGFDRTAADISTQPASDMLVVCHTRKNFDARIVRLNIWSSGSNLLPDMTRKYFAFVAADLCETA